MRHTRWQNRLGTILRCAPIRVLSRWVVKRKIIPPHYSCDREIRRQDSEPPNYESQKHSKTSSTLRLKRFSLLSAPQLDTPKIPQKSKRAHAVPIHFQGENL
jgi:hypothetical protein